MPLLLHSLCFTTANLVSKHFLFMTLSRYKLTSQPDYSSQDKVFLATLLLVKEFFEYITQVFLEFARAQEP